MEFLSPTTLADALAARAEHPGAVPIMGGTDVMVDELRPAPASRPCSTSPGSRSSRPGTGSATRSGSAPASPTRGWSASSPPSCPARAGLPHRRVSQIRNRGTVGGNLGAAPPPVTPTRRCSPPSRRSSSPRPRCTTRARARVLHRTEEARRPPDELVTAVWVRAATGPQQFSKIGTRNAMVIAVAAFGLALHPDRQSVGTGIGSAVPRPAARPTPRRSSRRSWTGSAGATCPPTSPRSSGDWSPPRRRRSTTCAAPRRTACTPSP